MRTRLLSLLLLAVLPCVLHLPELGGWISCNPLYFVSGLRDFPWHRLTDGACFLDGNAGQTTQALGREAARQWLSGSVPWWNHFSGAGLPLASIMQSGALFFPFVLLHHFFDGPLYLKLVLQATTGVFTWLFVREAGMSVFTALIAGVYFEFNGTFTLFSDAPMQPIAFLPLLMFGIERCRVRAAQGAAGGPAIVAVAIAYSLLAGFPETAFADGVLALLWALARARPGQWRDSAPDIASECLPKSSKINHEGTKDTKSEPIPDAGGSIRQSGPGEAVPKLAFVSFVPSWLIFFPRAIHAINPTVNGARATNVVYAAKIAGGGVCGLLLASPAVVPFLHDLQGADLGLHLLAQLSSINGRHALFILFPSMFGAPNANSLVSDWSSPWGYVGPSLSLLALLGFATGPWDRRKATLSGWFLFCLAGAFRWPIAGTLRDLLPGFDQLDFGRYVGPSAEFAAVLLAMIAVEQWRSGARVPRPWAAALMMIVVGIAVLYAGQDRVAYLLHTQWGWPLFAVSIAEAVLITVCLSALLSNPPQKMARAAFAGVVVLECLAFALPPVMAGTMDERVDNPAVSYLQQHAGFSRVYSMGGTFLPNYGAYYGVSQTNEMYVPLLKKWVEYEGRLSSLEFPTMFNGLAGTASSRIADLKSHRAALTSAGVAYLATLAQDDVLAGQNDPLFVPVFDDGRTHLYRLPDAAPYFEVVGGPCRLTIKSRDNVVAECKANGKLIRRELAFRKWTARINGHKIKLHSTPDIFQTVNLEAGDSQVVWEYYPSNIWVITIMFSLGVFWIAWNTIAQLAQSRRQCGFLATITWLFGI